jgi:hypothetical protein
MAVGKDAKSEGREEQVRSDEPLTLTNASGHRREECSARSSPTPTHMTTRIGVSPGDHFEMAAQSCTSVSTSAANTTSSQTKW